MFHLALSFWLPIYLLLQNVNSVVAKPRILIYSRTTGFRHDSIPVAINALRMHQDTIDAEFTATEDPNQFRDSVLSTFDAVLFLSTTGDVLDSAGEAALQKYLNNGGNFVGIHSASATLQNTSFYIRELGAMFEYHPELQNVTLDVAEHSSTAGLDSRWRVRDEMYNFDRDPRSLGAIVVVSVDYSTVKDSNKGPEQGTPHPIAWYQERGAGVAPGRIAGRSFYTSLGHLNATWESEAFLTHVFGGISYVLEGKTTKAFDPNALVGSPVPAPSNWGQKAVISQAAGDTLSVDTPISALPSTSSMTSMTQNRNLPLGMFVCILTGLIGLLL